jgi:hypothetical protein
VIDFIPHLFSCFKNQIKSDFYFYYHVLELELDTRMKSLRTVYGRLLQAPKSQILTKRQREIMSNCNFLKKHMRPRQTTTSKKNGEPSKSSKGPVSLIKKSKVVVLDQPTEDPLTEGTCEKTSDYLGSLKKLNSCGNPPKIAPSPEKIDMREGHSSNMDIADETCEEIVVESSVPTIQESDGIEESQIPPIKVPTLPQVKFILS